MKLEAIKGEKGSFNDRGVFQNGNKISNKDAVELLKQFPTKEAQATQGITVSPCRMFRYIVIGGDDAKLTGAKARGGYFVKDESGQWLFVTRYFTLPHGELRLNAENVYYAANDEADRITSYCLTNGISPVKELKAAGLWMQG